MARKTTDKNPDADVTAAGGVIVRARSLGLGRAPKLVVIHRPKYEDWSLPKGKLEPGEKFREAALREVLEETSLRCATETELSPVHYVDRKGRTKIVRYWLMRVLGGDGDFEPHDEVDEVRWLSPRKARAILTYDHDRELVDEAVEVSRALGRTPARG